MDTARSELKSVHFVGIKGVAMTSLAIYCKEKGMRVTGSDLEEDFPTKEPLEAADIHPQVGFTKDHILASNRPDLVVYTGAHGGKDNVEVVTAEGLGIETMPHGRALGYFMRGSLQISVAGSHGKTTTTAMIATIVSDAGHDPSYAVGCGMIGGLGNPGHSGKGPEFIVEADEYMTDPTHDKTPRFLWQNPDICVVTNIDYDHPDAYASLSEVEDAFVKFVGQQKGLNTLIINADDPKSSILAGKVGGKILSYGFSHDADVEARNVRFEEEKTLFDVFFQKTYVGTFSLSVPGMHNILNACGALAACYCLDISWEHIAKGLARFRGTKRRFEFVGSIGTIKVFDDYAHHPHEIEATLSGARDWYPKKRIITLFQPHTYSRTKALIHEFSTCFEKSDIVLIPDIYASARETENLGMHASRLVEEIAKNNKQCFYIKNFDGAIAFLKTHIQQGDILLCMGAGDVYGWGERIIQECSEKNS